MARYLPALPCWVQTLTVSYCNEPPESPGDTVYLEASAQEEMREATIYYHPAWLERSERDRDECVSHEFAHVAWLPACGLAEAVMRDANAPRALRDQWEDRVEAATQDTARIIRKAFA
jgi:hypothetical protein